MRFSFIRNDLTGEPIINYDLLLMNVPMLTLGTFFGLIFNQIFPEIIICFILTCVLLISLKKTYKRYNN